MTQAQIVGMALEQRCIGLEKEPRRLAIGGGKSCDKKLLHGKRGQEGVTAEGALLGLLSKADLLSSGIQRSAAR